MDEDGKPDFFAGMGAGDFVRIGIALLFSLGGLYLIWRMLFGPPLFDRAVQMIQSAERPPQTQSTVNTGPSEVKVGIGSGNPNNTQPQPKH
jgi:hypothetical protein